MAGNEVYENTVTFGDSLIERAMELEEQKRLEDAMKVYSSGIQCFISASRHTKRANEMDKTDAIPLALRQKIVDAMKKQTNLQARIARMTSPDLSSQSSSNHKLVQIQIDARSKMILYGFCRHYDLSQDVVNVLISYYSGYKIYQLANSAVIRLDGPTDFHGMGPEKSKLLVTTLPIVMPRLTKGLPIKNMLMHGPAACGKTYLVSQVVSSAMWISIHLSFLNIQIPDLVSGYANESVDIIRSIFQFAKDKSPCIVLLDYGDIDAELNNTKLKSDLCGNLKKEILAQTAQYRLCGGMVVITVREMPEDAEMLKEFPEQICVPLRHKDQRREILMFYADRMMKNLSEEDYDTLVSETERCNTKDIIHHLKRYKPKYGFFL
eukprot:67098_1